MCNIGVRKERHPDGPGKHIFVKTGIFYFYGLINLKMAVRSESDLIKGDPRFSH